MDHYVHNGGAECSLFAYGRPDSYWSQAEK
jgi:hypothetical protein